MPNRRKHMSKAEAIAEFKREVIPQLKRYHALKNTGQLSRADVRMAWSDYIDDLANNDYISMKQLYSWGSPFK